MRRREHNKVRIAKIKDAGLRGLVEAFYTMMGKDGIKVIQLALHRMGFKISYAGVDGLMGVNTLRALKRAYREAPMSLNRALGYAYTDVNALVLEQVEEKAKSKTHKITRAQILYIARKLGVSASMVYAVVMTESKGVLLDKKGRVPILYERHKCYKYLKSSIGKNQADKMANQYPDICNRRAGGYGKKNTQYARLHRAIELFGEDVAYSSTSFGFAQLMGFNHKSCGFKSATEMARAMQEEPLVAQIKGFVNFIKNDKNGNILRAMRSKNIELFSSLYNGKGYRKNKYAQKINKYLKKYIG